MSNNLLTFNIFPVCLDQVRMPSRAMPPIGTHGICSKMLQALEALVRKHDLFIDLFIRFFCDFFCKFTHYQGYISILFGYLSHE